MSSVEVIGAISAVIGLIDASIKIYESSQKGLKLSETFKVVRRRLPIILDTLQTCKNHLELIRDSLPADVCEALEKILEVCEEKAGRLRVIFEKVLPADNNTWEKQYIKVLKRYGKGSKVDELMGSITEHVQLLANHPAVKSAKPEQVAALEMIVEEMKSVRSSLPEDDSPAMTFYSQGGTQTKNVNSGSGQQINNNAAVGAQYLTANQSILSASPQIRAHLENPEVYDEALENFELSIFNRMNKCKVFEQEYADHEFLENVILSNPLKNVAQYLEQVEEILSIIEDSLSSLMTTTVAENAFSIITHSRSRSYVCKVQSIASSSISVILQCLAHFRARLNDVLENGDVLGTLLDDFSKLDDISVTVLDYFDFYSVRESSTKAVVGTFATKVVAALFHSRQLAKILAIGLLSYASSHTSSIFWDLLQKGDDPMLIASAMDGSGIYLHRSQLSCLSGFIGTRVNLFSQHQTLDVGQGLAVSTLLANFNDLWGPVQVVYTSEDERTAMGINTFGGTIRAMGESADSRVTLKDEIYCLWASWAEHKHTSAVVNFDPSTSLLIDGSDHFRINENCEPNKQTLYQT
ncbi:hypothetical protein LTS15_000685 [Exophiala xenobiotica]|nr:hypothetical protein LTS15_000685 [Exophiala xenobiotica]